MVIGGEIGGFGGGQLEAAAGRESGSTSFWERRAAQSREARAEGAREPSGGTA